MFQWVSIISFAVLFAGILLHHLIFPCGYASRFSVGSIIRKKVHLFTLLFPPQKLSLPGKLRKLIFLAGVLSFVVLMLSGFVPLIFGHKLEGYLLMIHATFAPVFIGCAAIVVILGAGEYVFNQIDAQIVSQHCIDETESGCWLSDTGLGVKAGFWLLAVLSLPVTLTMVLSMLPLFGTEGQELLFHLHRWSALLFAWIAIVELYMLIRMGIIRDMK